MFVMFPQLCQNLCLCTIFRQLWTIRGADTKVYPFSKYCRPLFWIFVTGIWSPDLLRTRVILPPHSKFHHNGTTCSWVIAEKWFLMPRPSAILNLRISDFFVVSVACGKICVRIFSCVKFGLVAAEIWRYNDFQNDGRPPCWIFEIYTSLFHHKW